MPEQEEKEVVTHTDIQEHIHKENDMGEKTERWIKHQDYAQSVKIREKKPRDSLK